MNNVYKQKRLQLLLSIFLVAFSTSYAQQSVTIGSDQLKDNAILWLNGDGSQGLLLPTVSSTNNVSSPEAGLVVYQTSDNRIYYFNGNSWAELGAGGSTGGNTYALQYDEPSNQLTLLENGNPGTAISLSNDAASLNGIDLPAGTPGTDQILVFNGSAWEYQNLPSGTFSGSFNDLTDIPADLADGDDVDDADADPLNEIQNISFDGGTNVLSLTEPGQPDQTVDLSSLSGGSSLTAGTGIDITGGLISNTGDTDGLDDMLIATYDGNSNSVVDNAESTQAIDGVIVDMSTAPTSGQVLKFIGGVWVPDADLQGSGGTLPTLADAQIITSSGADNPIAVTVSGALTMNSAGFFSLENDAVQLNNIQDNGANRAILANSSTGNVEWVTPSGDNQVLGSNGTGNLVFRDATTSISNSGTGIRNSATASDAIIATELSVREAIDAIGGSAAWNLSGNSGTNPGVGNDFIGTLDAQDLVFGTNSIERLRIASDASNNSDNLISITEVAGAEIRFIDTGDNADIVADNQMNISAGFLQLGGSETSISGLLGINNVNPNVSLDIAGTDAIRLPVGTDGQRPGTPTSGMIRFNSTAGEYEGYDGAVWNALGVGALTLQTAYDGGGNLIQQDGANNLEVLNSAGSLIQFYIDDATNNVGIGTSTPITTLDVRGESVGEGGILNLGNSDNSNQLTIFSGRDGDPEPFIQVTDGTPLRFATTAAGFTEIARFDDLGRFGIGTNLPLSALDVNGDIRASGHLASSVVGGEGGQITLGHQGNTTATGEGNSTWNIDVQNENLRVFNLDASGVGSVWMEINPPTNLMTIGQTNANIDFRGPLLLNGDVGTAGQILTSQGPGVAPIWAAVPGGGSLQGAYDGGSQIQLDGTNEFSLITSGGGPIITTDDANGFLGIGAPVPVSKLQIGAGDVQIDVGQSLLALDPTDDFAFQSTTVPQYSLGWNIDEDTPGLAQAWLSGFAGIKMFTNGANTFSVTQFGNVGIGTAAPLVRLGVSGRAYIGGDGSNGFIGHASTPTIDLSIDDNDTGFDVPADGQLAIYSDNQEQIRVTVDAVGVGTDMPQAQLDVVGNFKITDGTEAAGRVLTSDASGFATWQPPASSPWTLSSPDIYYNSGDVGIGTTNPAARLNVFNTDGQSILTLERDGTVGGGLDFTYSGTSLGYEVSSGDTGGMHFNAQGFNKISFEADGSERMRIAADGSVGIGNSLPTWRLEVEDDFSNNINPIANFTRSGTNGSAPIRMTNDNNFINLGLTQDEDFAISGLGANIGLATDLLTIDGATGNVGIGLNGPLNTLDVSGNMAIGSFAGTSTAPANGLIVSGNIGIGTTSPSDRLHVSSGTLGDITLLENSGLFGFEANADGLTIELGGSSAPSTANDFILFRNGSGTLYGSIDGNGAGSINYNTTSDRRLKQDIEPLADALITIKKLKPRTFAFKSTPDKKVTGFIAQELFTTFPEVVSGKPENDVDIDPMMVNYSMLTPLLTKAIQEQQELIENQQNEINQLKTALTKSEEGNIKVETELEALKAQVTQLANLIQAEAKKQDR